MGVGCRQVDVSAAAKRMQCPSWRCGDVVEVLCAAEWIAPANQTTLRNKKVPLNQSAVESKLITIYFFLCTRVVSEVC